MGNDEEPALAGDWKAAAKELQNMTNYETYRRRLDENIILLSRD
jgi:hypothetical protein